MDKKVILPGFKPRFEHEFQVVSTFNFVCWKFIKNQTLHTKLPLIIAKKYCQNEGDIEVAAIEWS